MTWIEVGRDLSSQELTTGRLQPRPQEPPKDQDARGAPPEGLRRLADLHVGYEAADSYPPSWS